MNIGDRAPEILGKDEEGIIEQILQGKQIKTKEHAEQILKG